MRYPHRHDPQHARIQLWLLLWPFHFIFPARAKRWHASLLEEKDNG